MFRTASPATVAAAVDGLPEPLTRSRTLLFVSYRDSLVHADPFPRTSAPHQSRGPRASAANKEGKERRRKGKGKGRENGMFSFLGSTGGPSNGSGYARLTTDDPDHAVSDPNGYGRGDGRYGSDGEAGLTDSGDEEALIGSQGKKAMLPPVWFVPCEVLYKQALSPATGSIYQMKWRPYLPAFLQKPSLNLRASRPTQIRLVSAIDKLHAKHLLPSFLDRSAEERQIDQQTVELTRDFQRCKALIASISSRSKPSSGPSSSSSSEADVIASNVQKALATRLQTLSSSFRRRQRLYMEKLQGYVQRSAGISHPLEGPPPTETSFASLEDDIKASQTASQAQLQVSAQSLTDEQLQRKDREITHIAQSIADLAQLFNEINDMVIDQGTMLDRIDYNIQNTSDNVQQANQELKIATTYQRRSSRRACIFLLLLVIFGMIVILLNKPGKQTSTP